MRKAYQAFLKGISADLFSRIGAVLVTSSILSFLLFELLRIGGIVTNAYVGLITYMAFPLLFFIGLALIPAGWYRLKKKTGKSYRELAQTQFSAENVQAYETGSRIMRTILLLSLVNVIFIGGAGLRTLHFMDGPEFCGTACHTVMHPEWISYQESPHAHVRCVDCHVGEGVDALVDAKLNGMWQIISATFHLYEQPIPTPVHNLRPARETCEHCHWPDKFLGNRIITHVHYNTDEFSTPEYTTLMLKIGTGAEGMEEGSHWHVAETNEVRYASIDDERQEMIWVEREMEDGSVRRFTNTRLRSSGVTGEEHIRSMDCVDCHNRATHIYEYPDDAVDQRMQRGFYNLNLPFLKERVLGAIINEYPSVERAMVGIENHIRGYYRRDYSDDYSGWSESIDEAVAVTQAIYHRNIHPGMDVVWGSYPNHLGHRNSRGCFRCHNTNMVEESGERISMECTLCHSILAYESDVPFEFLRSSDEVDSTRQEIREYLHGEFRETSGL